MYISHRPGDLTKVLKAPLAQGHPGINIVVSLMHYFDAEKAHVNTTGRHVMPTSNTMDKYGVTLYRLDGASFLVAKAVSSFLYKKGKNTI